MSLRGARLFIKLNFATMYTQRYIFLILSCTENEVIGLNTFEVGILFPRPLFGLFLVFFKILMQITVKCPFEKSGVGFHTHDLSINRLHLLPLDLVVF